MAAVDAKIDGLTAMATIFRFIQGPGTDVMQAVFRAFYSSTAMQSNDGQMSLREYKTEKNISKTKIDNTFGKMVNSLMDVDLMKEQLDISFYYAAITKLNETLFNNIDDRSKQIMKEIKDNRNELCHNKTLNKGSLRAKLESLENLYFELLDVFEKKNFPLNSYLQEARLSLRSLITLLKDEPVSTDVYLQEREKFFAELQNKIIRDGREELIQRSPFGRSIDPLSKLLKLCCSTNDNEQPVMDVVFTPPWIQHGQQKLSYHLLLNTSNEDGEVPRVVFVSGLGGSGKSVLVQRIFAQWHKNKTSMKNLDRFNFVFKVELKHTCSKSLQDLLSKELLVETMKLANWSEVFPLLKNLNILFLVDGFDEVREEYKSLVKEIACLLPDSHILLTTRPEYIKEAENIFQSSTKLTLDLQGFDIDDRKEFARKVLTCTEESSEQQSLKRRRFCQFLDTRSHTLQTHLKLPLTVALLIFLWLEYQNNLAKLDAINTATQLHRELFHMLRKKLITDRPLFANVPDKEKVVDIVLHRLHGRALEQLDKNVLPQLSDESFMAVEHICSENKLDKDQQTEFLSAYLVCDPDIAQKPTKKKKPTTVKLAFSFFYKVQMEYFSAEHVVGELKENGQLTLTDCLPSSASSTDGRRFKGVLPFIGGCLSLAGLLENYVAELVSLSKAAEVHETDFNYWFMLVSETALQDPTLRDLSYNDALCREVAKRLPYQRPWVLKTETIISGLSLLIHCETVWMSEMEIDFRINDDLNDVKDLKIILQKASFVLGRRLARNKIALSLHVRSQRMIYNEGRTDPYLKYFLPWTQLVKFTGHVGPETVQQLTDCKHIDVKLESLDGFNAFMKLWKKFRVKKLTITANFIHSLEGELVLPIPYSWNCEFRILFHGVTSSSLDRVITFVERCTSNGNSFLRLGVHKSCLSYSDGVRLFASLQNLVTDKVTVESSVHLTDEQEQSILREALALARSDRPSMFQTQWNNRDIVE